MENKNGTLAGALSSIFAFVLFNVFMILKLCGVINWSWWWVAAPLWVGVALIVLLGVILLIAGVTYGTVLEVRRRQYLNNIRQHRK